MKILISDYTQEELMKVQQLAIDIANKYDTTDVYITEGINNDGKETQLYRVINTYEIVAID